LEYKLGDLNTNYTNFEEKMKQLKITQIDFARFLGISYTSIHKWKKRGTVPRYAIIVLNYIENAKKDIDFMKEFKTLCSKK